MLFSQEELLERKSELEKVITTIEARYKAVQGTDSLSEITSGTDLVSLKEQVKEIDAVLNNLIYEEPPEVPQEELRSTPASLVTGTPPRRGVPSDARIIRKSDGSFYYVDSTGKIIPRLD